VFFRDVAQIVVVVFQIWMWSVPLVYVEELLPTLYRQTLAFNPAYPFIRAIRDLYLSNAIPELWIWTAMFAWVAILTGVGLVRWRQRGPRFGPAVSELPLVHVAGLSKRFKLYDNAGDRLADWVRLPPFPATRSSGRSGTFVRSAPG